VQQVSSTRVSGDPSARQLCACGSGLTQRRCCGLDMAALPPPAAVQHLVPLIDRALQAWKERDRVQAERLCIDVLELAPDRPRALGLLFEIRKQEGKLAAALALARRIVAFDPNNFAATGELTLLLLRAGALAQAEHHARNAVRIAPDRPQSHSLLGMVLTELGRTPAGEYHYRRVLELGGEREPVTLANLAWNLKSQGRVEEARALYAESVAARPDIPQTLLGWARLEEADRKLDAAAERLDALAQVAPDNPGLKLTRAAVLSRQKRLPEALALLEGAEALGPMELAGKGRLLDRMGRHDEAWAAFAEGKRVVREVGGTRYLRDQAETLAARLRAFFTAKRLSLLPRAGAREDGPQPIFILGFPRSGTTLLEQTLSAAPGIAAGDELSFINDIARVMPRMLDSPLSYPEALAELWMGDQREGLDNLRDHYLQKARQAGVLKPGAMFFTDKMPLNETHLGLIALLFPHAPLLHMIRHPLDVMVSAMANHFTHGFHCATALETAASHYMLIAELVEHYKAEMTLRYLPVRYEDMVDRQEETVRAVFDFIGHEFDPAALAFENNARYARTASYAQVTEALYERSRYRFRHYLPHLGPAIDLLRPAIERLSYPAA
jgi:tetratricopeptide (TPR) repeat protein